MNSSKLKVMRALLCSGILAGSMMVTAVLAQTDSSSDNRMPSSQAGQETALPTFSVAGYSFRFPEQGWLPIYTKSNPAVGTEFAEGTQRNFDRIIYVQLQDRTLTGFGYALALTPGPGGFIRPNWCNPKPLRLTYVDNSDADVMHCYYSFSYAIDKFAEGPKEGFWHEDPVSPFQIVDRFMKINHISPAGRFYVHTTYAYWRNGELLVVVICRFDTVLGLDDNTNMHDSESPLSKIPPEKYEAFQKWRDQQFIPFLDGWDRIFWTAFNAGTKDPG